MTSLSALSELAIVFAMSAAACLLAGRYAIPWLLRTQHLAPIRYEDCPSLLAYQQTKPRVPTMGGIFVVGVAMLIAIIAGGVRSMDGWLIALTTLATGAIGGADDVLKVRGPNGRGFRSLPKLVLTFLVGGLFGVCTWSTAPMLPVFWILFTMIVVAGTSHAVNLTDGMDGLAAGCAAIAFATLGFMEQSNPTLPIWCAILAGVCVGFLWFNTFPASVYLGDLGAMALGGALAAIALLSRHPFRLVVIGGIFVIEAISVMAQVSSYKWRNKQRIFRVAPIHHHFHLGGIPEPKVIVRFWIVGALLAAVGLTRAGHP